jgi:hypothetical protein
LHLWYGKNSYLPPFQGGTKGGNPKCATQPRCVYTVAFPRGRTEQYNCFPPLQGGTKGGNPKTMQSNIHRLSAERATAHAPVFQTPSNSPLPRGRTRICIFRYGRNSYFPPFQGGTKGGNPKIVLHHEIFIAFPQKELPRTHQSFRPPLTPPF